MDKSEFLIKNNKRRAVKARQLKIKGLTYSSSMINPENGKRYYLKVAKAEDLTITENQFIHMLFRMKNIELVGKMSLNSLVKVAGISSSNKDNIIFNDKEYRFLLATPNQIKKGEGFYILADDYDVALEIFNIASGGAINRLKGNSVDKIAISKDISARLSLLFSASLKTNIRAKMIVVPDVKSIVEVPNSRILKDGVIVDAEGEECLNEVTNFDGCGVATPEVFEAIAEDLGLNHCLAFSIIRTSMATKGLITNVNILQYLEDKFPQYKEADGKFYIKDCWGTKQEVTSNCIILNQSMVKWNGWYNSLEEYYELQNKEYADLTDCLYITKTSKEFPKNYGTTSYQLLNMLALTYKDMIELAIPTYNFLKGVVELDEVSVKSFLKINSDLEFVDGVEEVIASTQTDKVNVLLGIDYKRFIKVPRVRASLRKMVTKKIQQLASGKVYIDNTSVKYLSADSLLFLNYCMEQNQREISDLSQVAGGLKKGEFYVAGEVGERFCLRYPIAHYQEITKEILIANTEYDKYCNYNSEILTINQRWIDAMVKSGCDFDGDLFIVSANPVLIRSVIAPKDGKVFINKEDGNIKAPKVAWNEYTDEMRVADNLKITGNEITKLALIASTIGDRCQQIYFEYEQGNYLDTMQMRAKQLGIVAENMLVELRSNASLSIEGRKGFEEYYSMFKNSTQLPEETQRNQIINNFYSDYVESKLAYILQLSMKEIDSSKTGVSITKEELRVAKTGFELYPSFFRALPDKKHTRKKTTYNLSTLTLVYKDIVEGNYKNIIPSEDETEVVSNFPLYWDAKNNSKKNYDVSDTISVLIGTLSETLDFSNNEGVAECESKIYESFRFKEDSSSKANALSYDIKQLKKAGKDYIKLEEEKEFLFDYAKFKCEVDSKEIYDSYSEEVITKALIKLGHRDRKDLGRLNEYLLDYHWQIVEKAIVLNYSTMTVVQEDEDGKLMLFNKVKLVEAKIKEDSTGIISAREKELTLRKLDGKIKFLINPLIIQAGASNLIYRAREISIVIQEGTYYVTNDEYGVLGTLYKQFIEKGIVGKYKVKNTVIRSNTCELSI